ncbi:MAG TPA: protein phosphatase 2C domain-containing protein [Ktedonobacteraceae bacterium]
MLIQRDNDPWGASHHERVCTPAGADGGVNTGKPGLALQVGSHLDPGIRRKHKPNEDTILVTQSVMPSPKPFALLIVADGVGGQAHGQEASRLAVQSLAEYVTGSLRPQQMMSAALLPLLIAGVQYANQLVYQHNRVQRDEMGTTLTATLVMETTAYVAHVGDSRLYLHHQPTGLAQITRDHSVAAAFVAAGVIGPDDFYTHPGRNQVYRILGEKPTVEVDASVVPLAAGDILLLCSDGLWEMVRDQQIAAILTTPLSGPSATAHALVQAALAGGGEDNVSAVVAQVGNV